MTQEQLELNLVASLSLPRKTIHMLIDQFVDRFYQQTHLGHIIIIARLGRFSVTKISARRRHDIHTGTVHVFPAKNVSKLRVSGNLTQFLNPAWRPTRPYYQDKESARAGIAHEMNLHFGTDLLSCNTFLFALIDQIRTALASDGTVTLNNWGTLYRYTKAARNGKNPRTGAHISIPALNAVRWRPCEKLRQEVN